MVTRLGCEGAMVGNEWANSCPGCMNGFRKTLLSPFWGLISDREGSLGFELVSC